MLRRRCGRDGQPGHPDRDTPLADVLFGVDNTFLSRALEADLFEPYDSAALAAVPRRRSSSTRRAGRRPSTTATCASTSTVGVFERRARRRPRAPRGPDRDPSTEHARGREPGHVVARASPSCWPRSPASARDRRPTWHDYWAACAPTTCPSPPAGRTRTTASSRAARARATAHRGLLRLEPRGRGRSSPTRRRPSRPTADVDDGCFRQVEFAGSCRDRRPELRSAQLIDFLLARPVQEDIPLNMFVYPVVARRVAARGVRRAVRPGRTRSPCDGPRADRAPTASAGSRSGPTSSCAEAERPTRRCCWRRRRWLFLLAVLRLAGRYHPRRSAWRRAANSTWARRRDAGASRSSHRRRLVHALAGGAVHAADPARWRCPAAWVLRPLRVPRP